MKRLSLVALLLLTAAIASAAVGPAALAAPKNGDLERVVFIHYPKNMKPDKSPPGASGSLCPNAVTCPDYKYSGYRWPGSNPNVSWQYNLAGVSGNSTGFASAVSESFQAWDTKNRCLCLWDRSGERLHGQQS